MSTGIGAGMPHTDMRESAVTEGLSQAHADERAPDPAADDVAEAGAAGLVSTDAEALSTRVLVVAGLGLTGLWATAVWTSTKVAVDPLMHEVALFVHLACLVLGFGAVLTIDWVGLLWMTRRRRLVDVLQVAGSATLPIWLGLAGLVVSGALLSPDASSPITWLKLTLVLLIGWNGLHVAAVHQQMVRLGGQAPGRRLLLRGSASAMVSQMGWWGAVLIGFLNSRA